MCCFSRKIESVTGTNIFARDSEKSLQYLVYEMTLLASEDLAMILPIPVPRKTPENAVRFISLEKYPEFFKAMESGFDILPRRLAGMGGLGGFNAPKLPVINVGSFEASFVPSIGDFPRLDERFRLPNGTWDNLPRYKNYGFAVFKLEKGHRKTHPMAFEFPRWNPEQLFFPTVHIHDGQVYGKAEFDHILYSQFGERRPRALHVWTESARPAGMFLVTDKCEGLVDEDSHVYKRVIRGKHKNSDILA